MMLFPEVARKAQREIDEYFGDQQRLPDLSDREHLPYVSCILKETYRYNTVLLNIDIVLILHLFRWCPPVPLGISCDHCLDHLFRDFEIPLYIGIPHAASETYRYNDQTIPQRAMIIPNIWSADL